MPPASTSPPSQTDSRRQCNMQKICAAASAVGGKEMARRGERGRGGGGGAEKKRGRKGETNEERRKLTAQIRVCVCGPCEHFHFVAGISCAPYRRQKWRRRHDGNNKKKATKLRVSPTNTLTNTNNTNNTHTLARSRSLTLTENACVQRGNKKNNKKRQGGGRASEREAPGATDVIKEIIVTMSAAEASSEWRHTNTRAPQTDTRTRTSDGRFVSRFDKLKNQQFKVEVRWVWSNLP